MESNVSTETNTGSEGETRGKIVDAYREYVLMNGQQPASVYAFCKDLGITENEFYLYFNNFEQVSASFWEGIHHQTTRELDSRTDFEETKFRGKLTAYYSAFFDKLRPHRSFSILSFSDNLSPLEINNQRLQSLRKSFTDWTSQQVNNAIDKGEIPSRARLSSTYPNVLWLQFLFLLNYWRRDNSQGFSNTKDAIDKAVKLSFDLMEKNALDSALDFGKFIFQNR